MTFYCAGRRPARCPRTCATCQRQAFAGMLWSKQFYHYLVNHWLDGDPRSTAAARERKNGRNHDWTHLYNADVLSMPDKWEYPGSPPGISAFH